MAANVADRPGAQPESDRVWSIETNGINPIPDAERHGKPSDMFWVWCFANIAILGIAYGGYLVSFYGVSLWQGIVAAVVGTVVSFLLVGSISFAGMLGGAPTFVLSRAAFGVRGNAIPTVVSYISLVGWETILTALAALSVAAVMDRLGLASGKPTLAIAFAIIAAITIAIGLLGHATIIKVATWSTYAFAVLTVVFMGFEWSHIDWTKVSHLPSGPFLGSFVGGLSIVMAGLGIGWVNAAADYSRYLPRSSRPRAVVAWTTFGASIGPVILIVFGLLIAANNPDLANSSNPIGVLARDVPTWFLVPYMIAAAGGLIAGALLDIYSSGLNLLSLGVRIPRYRSVAIDGTLMVIGNVYILFYAPNFFAPFQGFLITLGVLLAAWSAIFLVDLWMFRRQGYDREALYTPSGRYGSVNLPGVASFLVASALGLGLVTSSAGVFKPWVGYLLGAFGGKTGAVGGSSIGLLIAFFVAGLLYAALSSLVAGRTDTLAPAREAAAAS